MEFEFTLIKSKVQIEGVSHSAVFTKDMYDKSVTELIVVKYNETNCIICTHRIDLLRKV
jgi:hypothetical protein